MDGHARVSATCQRETVASVIEEMKLYLDEEWLALGRNHDKIALKIEYEKYRRIEAMGGLRIFTVRADGELAGWLIYMVNRHLNFADHLFCKSNAFWIRPEWRGRGFGSRLMQFAVEQLTADRVAVMHTTATVQYPGTAKFLEAQGHTLIEYGYEKVLIGKDGR